jgi:rhodanese-related sulfurtransferase
MVEQRHGHDPTSTILMEHVGFCPSDTRTDNHRPRIMTAMTDSAVDRLLAAARHHLDRVEPADLADEMDAGALVVDIRPEANRRDEGSLPGAIVIERNVLEWRLDPTSPDRIPEADRPDRRVVLVCNEGYASSLAAAALRDLGLPRATDLVGGYRQWKQVTGG